MGDDTGIDVIGVAGEVEEAREHVAGDVEFAMSGAADAKTDDRKGGGG